MKARTSFRNTFILLAVIAVVILVAYYFIYRDIKNKNEHISSLVQELSVQSDRQEYLISTERMIESVQSDIDKVNGSIIGSDGDVAFIEQLEDVAKNNGLSVSIDSLDVTDVPILKTNGITELTIKAKTSGSWAGTYAFLTQLEALPFKVRINNFSLVNSAASGATSSPSVWDTTFNINVLKYK